ncbi:MAG: hypothetical protein AAGA56_23090 [Myxococcota bacterium]
MTVFGALRGVTAAAAASALVLGACAPRDSAEGPRDALQAYASALRERRVAAAYQMLSDEAKRNLSFDAFRRMVEESPEDVEEITGALIRQGSEPEITAVVTGPGGESVTLVFEGGRWTVDGTGVDRYGQTSPRQALEGFIRAFERRRFDVLMRYVPDAEKLGDAEQMWGKAAPADGGTPADDKAPPAPEKSPATEGAGLTEARLKEAWTGEQKEYITGVVEAVKSALPTAKIEETEDRAAMPFGTGGTVLLVREDSRWKIEDFQ